METREVHIGKVTIGGSNRIAVQTMCNTHTYEVDATVEQCKAMAAAGVDIIRITVPGLNEVENMKQIKEKLLACGIDTPLVADIHFSSETAIAVAPIVEKVRINPGNFHKDHQKAREQFQKLLGVCKENGTAIRIGLNHGSLGEYITNLYGNTPFAMAKAAMEWIEMAVENDFYEVVVSLKSSNTIVMVEAYRELAGMMKEYGVLFPMHVGVTEAGNGDSGRIKSCVGISTLLEEGIGSTLRVSLTEDPVNEIGVGQYLASRYSSCPAPQMPQRELALLTASCDWGKKLLDREVDEPDMHGQYGDAGFEAYLTDELLQASRRRFYKPEYVACPGCGRTMYDLQGAFEEVKARTSHLKDIVIAVMGCIVNGPGEMADADWGYVGEGNHKVSIYHGKEPVLRHVPDTEAVDKLLELIENSK